MLVSQRSEGAMLLKQLLFTSKDDGLLNGGFGRTTPWPVFLQEPRDDRQAYEKAFLSDDKVDSTTRQGFVWKNRLATFRGNAKSVSDCRAMFLIGFTAANIWTMTMSRMTSDGEDFLGKAVV